jgi:hypothetical protein
MKLLLLKKDTVRLLRIPFSLFLMPVFLLALSQSHPVLFPEAILSFIIIHFMVYPASNGYNSYIDRDETSIGGLERPPLPTKELFYATIGLDIFAVCLSFFFVNALFSLCILLYILASRAYSSRQIRLKKYPFAGFFVVFFFQGAFTYIMSAVGITGKMPDADFSSFFILAASSLQIGGAYPLTQIYQHAEDKASGDNTISLLLGIRGTFIFTAIMFALCNVFYFLYFRRVARADLFIYLQFFFIPVIAYFCWWFVRCIKDPAAANYNHTMMMNKVASVCSSACFILFIVLRA